MMMYLFLLITITSKEKCRLLGGFLNQREATKKQRRMSGYAELEKREKERATHWTAAAVERLGARSA